MGANKRFDKLAGMPMPPDHPAAGTRVGLLIGIQTVMAEIFLCNLMSCLVLYSAGVCVPRLRTEINIEAQKLHPHSTVSARTLGEPHVRNTSAVNVHPQLFIGVKSTMIHAETISVHGSKFLGK